MRRTLTPLHKYAAAAGLVAVTTALIYPVGPAHYQTLLPAYLLAVMSSALFFGLGPGILASALAAVAIDFFFTAPYYRLFPITPTEGMRVLTYTLLSLVLNGLVTARKRAEQRLTKERIDREVAEASDRLKSSVIAGVSTAIRGPLQEIIRQAGRLEGSEGAGPGRLEVATSIRRHGGELMRLMTELGDLGRFASGTLEVTRAPVTLPALARGVVRSFAATARERGINLELVVDGPIPITVATDACKLRSILENVIRNGLDFTKEGFVRVTLRLDDEDAAAPKLLFTVHDSGVGIPSDQLAGIFEPFMTGAPHRSGRGAGLGLAWSRLLARKLGGDVRLLRTTSGVGSTFEVSVSTGPLDGVEMIRIVGDEDEPSSIVPYPSGSARRQAWVST
jgi:signal transduction histidine kinase